MPPKNKYVAFGSTTLSVPPKMVGYDKNHKAHLWDTITPIRHQLSYHNNKTAINLTTNPASKRKIQKVPRTTKYMSYISKENQGQPAPLAYRAPPPAPLPPPPPPPPAPLPLLETNASSVINNAIKAKLARLKLESLRQDKNFTTDIIPLNVPRPNIFGLSLENQRIETSAVKTLQRNIKIRLAKKELKKLERKKKVETAMKKFAPIEKMAFIPTADINVNITDTYEKERLKNIEEIAKKQQERNKELNRREKRKKEKRENIKILTDAQVEDAAARTIQQLLLKVKNKKITEEKKIESVSILARNYKNRIARKEYQKLKNKKLQQILLESPIEETPNMIQETKEKKALEANHIIQMEKIKKLANKIKKEKKMEEPTSFQDIDYKNNYIKVYEDEAEVNREEGLKISKKVLELKSKPYTFRNQEKIYTLTQDAYIYALEFERIIKVLERAKKIPIAK